jgi:phage terminase small subunit
MNKKPPELHLVDGTKSRTRGELATLPATIRKRIPAAAWMDNPDAWDKAKFIEETSEFLHTVYGIGNDQDSATLTILADHIETYVDCSKMLRYEDENGKRQSRLVIPQNDNKTLAPSPWLSIRNKTTTLIIQLMNELGLTPRSRLAAGKSEDDSPVSRLLKGPFGA